MKTRKIIHQWKQITDNFKPMRHNVTWYTNKSRALAVTACGRRGRGCKAWLDHFCRQSIRLWGSGRRRVAYTGTLCFFSSLSVVGPTASICNKGFSMTFLVVQQTLELSDLIECLMPHARTFPENDCKTLDKSRRSRP